MAGRVTDLIRHSTSTRPQMNEGKDIRMKKLVLTVAAVAALAAAASAPAEARMMRVRPAGIAMAGGA